MTALRSIYRKPWKPYYEEDESIIKLPLILIVHIHLNVHVYEINVHAKNRVNSEHMYTLS